MQVQQKDVTKLVGFYRGEVIKHEEGGKCKIFIPGVYPDKYKYSPINLPDAEQAAPLFGGVQNGNGMFSYPNIGAIVWVFFENCDQNRPVYFAATLGGEFPTQTPEEGFQEIRSNVQEDSEDDKKDTTRNGEDTQAHTIVSGNCKIFIHECGQLEIVCGNGEQEDEESDENDVKTATESYIRMDNNGTITIFATNKIHLDSSNIVIDGYNLVDLHTESFITTTDIQTVVDSPKCFVKSDDSFTVESPCINMDAEKGAFNVTGKKHGGLLVT